MQRRSLSAAVLLLGAVGWAAAQRPEPPPVIAASSAPRTPPAVLPPGSGAAPAVPLPPPAGLPVIASSSRPAAPNRPAGVQPASFRDEPSRNGQAVVPASYSVTPAAPVRAARPQLALTLTGPETAGPGDLVTFEIELTNVGSAATGNVLLRVDLPAGLRSEHGGAVEADVGTLEAGENKAVALEVTAVEAGRQVSAARATAGDVVATAQAAVVVAEKELPSLSLEVMDRDDPVEVGGETVYEIRVVNQGDGPCGNVQVRAAVPGGLTLLGADGPTSPRLQDGEVVFEPVPRLAAGDDARFRLHVKAARPGDWRLRVTLTCDDLDRPVHEEESTEVYDGDDGNAAPGGANEPMQDINKRKL